MSLTDQLRAENRTTRRCIAGRWLESLPETEQDEVRQWLDNGGRKSVLLRVARTRGYEGSNAMLYSHTLRSCCCPVEATA
ncbi:hypothetical protein [Nocardia testacea]|uniref:hypothetical protein n=1 Tax=Nocardia testacea TaxID=248551 RepID=UPI003A83FDBF